ncbi:MAG TPA: hypothetical protein VJ063_14065 [Verrucomicrobiae bacterium]|nr:hypothetical protein [Verrucomicrobiae bacterium]
MPLNIKRLVIALACGAVLARAQEPKISSIEPSALVPGKTTRIVLHGDNLETNWTLWASFPCAVVGDQVTLPPDAPVGIGAVRGVTPTGASAFHLIMIDDLPTVKESGSNQTVAVAQEIKPPIAVDGACNDLNFDFYAFQARKGQEYSIEAVAQRLGSQADTVIRILDDKGHEYAFCDDGPGVGRDSRLIFRAPATARYLIEVRDINYQGGTGYRYRLRVGSFPLLTVPYPPVIPRGKTSDVWLANPKPLKVSAPADAIRIPLSVRGKAGSGFASVLVSDLDEVIEKEPNDTIEQVSLMKESVCGRFERGKDRDLFRFEAKKDERLVVAARTRSLGSACDVLLNILKGDGSKLVEANVTGADEGTITNTFKEAGSYFAELQELTESAGPDFIYRLTVSRLDRGFELSTEQDRWETTKEGYFTLKVSCARRQFEGPITLSLIGGDDLTIENNLIAEKKNETVLKLKPGPDFPHAKLVQLRLAGKSTESDMPRNALVSTAPALRKLWPKLPTLPLELDGLTALLVP